MITLLFILSLYSATLSTILFARWMRLLMAKRNIRKQIEKNNLSLEKQEFIAEHPLIPMEQVIKDIEEELEGEVVRGFEAEADRAESEEVAESVEESEWREEEMINLKRQQRK